MNNELDNIKEKVINTIAIISAFFIGFPYVLSVLRFIRVGWDITYIWHTIIYGSVIVIAVFRHRLPVKIKIIIIACIYTLIAVISLYKFAFFGAYYFVFIGIAILVILYGLRISYYFTGFFSIVYMMIGYGYVMGYLEVPMPQDYSTNIFSWVAILFTLISLSLVVIKGFGQFYTELIVIINNKEKTEKELENHKNELEKRVVERTQELEQAIVNLKETQSQLLHAEKMASLGILTAGISHEINNPLNYIMGGYTGLEQYFEDRDIKDETVSILLKSIKTGIERSSKIVSGLNQFSRNNDEFNEPCNIHDILDNCLLVVENQLKNRIEVERNYSIDECLVRGNVGKMHQVFLNILVNAYQSIDDNGNITITTNVTKENVTVNISDTGAGIDKQELSKVMDPFYTTKDPGVGTGLGLSITYSIIKEHNGELDIESEINKGTSVIITLPNK